MRRLAFALALLLTLENGPPARGEAAPPVNLGAPGLTLQVRLYRFTAATGWQLADASAVTLTDLGSGDYLADGLPDAAGDERYRLLLAEAGELTRALAGYTYGAPPQQRIVWRQVLEPTPVTLRKRGDTHGALSLQVRSGLPASIADPATTVTFTLWSTATRAAVFTGRPAAASNVVLDATSGTHGATLAYDLSAGDLDTAGVYLGEFTVTFPDGSVLTLPATDQLRVRVVQDFDGI